MPSSLGQVLLFAGVIACINAAVVRNSRGACPPFTSKPDFNYLQYAGVWFEIEKIPVSFEEGMTCIRAIYDEIAPNVISVVNTAVLADGNLTDIYGTAYQPYPETEPGHLIVSFNARAGGADYYVLDTDYVTYAAVYNCFNIGEFKVEYAWILARANSLSPEELTFARNVFISNGVDTSTFEPTYQDSKCLYFP
ncbi:hypothetical protein GHT06_018039 [Daphnia sinensis]|uniref:Apolipoprotein D n=1 Tax=Daphnia sinensis TaxID=1820382 RepID=A0AAD5PSR2_9CRUS|nr:hypothetical protein GHT06_018039 [Daphnia sinensis]